MAKHKKINIDNVKIVMRDDSGMYAGYPELKPQKTEIDWVWEMLEEQDELTGQ